MLPRQQILISSSSSHQLVGLVDLKRYISFVAAVKHVAAYFSNHVCCDWHTCKILLQWRCSTRTHQRMTRYSVHQIAVSVVFIFTDNTCIYTFVIYMYIHLLYIRVCLLCSYACIYKPHLYTVYGRCGKCVMWMYVNVLCLNTSHLDAQKSFELSFMKKELFICVHSNISFVATVTMDRNEQLCRIGLRYQMRRCSSQRNGVTRGKTLEGVLISSDGWLTWS